MAQTDAMPAAPQPSPAERRGAPLWLVAATAVMALLILVLAVAETSITVAYLVDSRGEFISLFGLAFILVAGLYLWRQGRLYGSLPLVLPWLLYPIVTQGDQIIDNLSINPMRIVCDVLLAAIFAAPVAVVVLTARAAFEPKPGRRLAARPWLVLVPGLRQLAAGHRREGAAVLAATLLALEIWLAEQYLGTLMVGTLIVMIVGVLIFGSAPESPDADRSRQQARSERFALGVLLAGVVISLATYVGYTNQPGAYQGSPSFFMDPAEKDKNYRVDRIPVPGGAALSPAASPEAAELVRAALAADAHALERLLAGYHLLNRNYTYDFHNELFLRHQPLVPNYRAEGLKLVAEAAALRADADVRAARARQSLKDDDPLAALLEDVRDYLAFNVDRAPVLERMSAGFQRTQAGLQHAAHLYEGESKYLGAGLSDILKKYQRVVDAPELAPVTSEFMTMSRALYESYASRIVGF